MHAVEAGSLRTALYVNACQVYAMLCMRTHSAVCMVVPSDLLMTCAHAHGVCQLQGAAFVCNPPFPTPCGMRNACCDIVLL